MKCIIFGVSGQDGYYLKKLLEINGFGVIGISRSAGEWIKGEIGDFNFVSNLIKLHQPSFVFHLAANSTTKHDVLFENHTAIGTGTLNILEAVKNHSLHSKVFLSGSALQFKNEGKPIKETDEFDPKDIYSVQRVYSVNVARYYRSLGIKVYIGYFFHHDSPLRSERHLSMKIIRAALRIKAGSREFLELGNPEVTKEFNHALDMMEAIWILVNQEDIYEAVIGCGKGFKILDWIQVCEKIIDIDLIKKIKINPIFKSEFNTLISNPFTIKNLGWQQKFNITDLAIDMININEK